MLQVTEQNNSIHLPVLGCLWNKIFRKDLFRKALFRKAGVKKMAAVGFEPTPPKRLVP